MASPVPAARAAATSAPLAARIGPAPASSASAIACSARSLSARDNGASTAAASRARTAVSRTSSARLFMTSSSRPDARPTRHAQRPETTRSCSRATGGPRVQGGGPTAARSCSCRRGPRSSDRAGPGRHDDVPAPGVPTGSRAPTGSATPAREPGSRPGASGRPTFPWHYEVTGVSGQPRGFPHGPPAARSRFPWRHGFRGTTGTHTNRTRVRKHRRRVLPCRHARAAYIRLALRAYSAPI